MAVLMKSIRSLVTFAPCLLLLFSSPVNAQNELWINEISAAMDCQDQDDYVGALQHYDRAMEIEPHSCHNQRGDCFLALGKNLIAINEYNQAIKKEPQNPHSYLGRARANKALGKTQQAIKDLKIALRIMNAQKEETERFSEKMRKLGVFHGDVMLVIHINVYRERADIYKQEKMYQEALADRWHVVKLRRPQGFVGDYAELALAYLDIGDDKNAKKYEDKARALMAREQKP